MGICLSSCNPTLNDTPPPHIQLSPLKEPLSHQQEFDHRPKTNSHSDPHDYQEHEFNIPELRLISDRAQTTFFTLLNSLDPSDFTLNYEKDGCRVMTADTQRNFLIWTVFDMPFPADSVMAFLKDIEHRTDWDPNMQEARIVCKVDDDTFVNYQTYKGVLAVKPRDLLILSSYRNYKGSKCEFSQSIQSLHYPERDDAVRAKLEIGGMVVQAVDANSCKVTSISETDLGGALPKMIVKKLSTHSFPSVVKNMRAGMSRLHS